MNGKLILFIVLAICSGGFFWMYARSRALWKFIVAMVSLVGLLVSGAVAVGPLYSFMAGFGVLMGYAALESKRGIWGRPVAALCCFMILVLGVVNITRTVAGVDRIKARQETIRHIDSGGMEHERAKFTEIGRVLGKTFVGTKALLIVSPYVGAEMLGVQTAALEQGISSLLVIAAKESWTADDSGANTEPAMLAATTYNANKFDQFVKRHPECNLVISLAGLPPDAEAIKLWEAEPLKRPKVALVDASIGAYKGLFSDAKVHLAIVQKPGSFIDVRNTAQLADRMKYFSDYFVVVTEKNWQEMFANNQFPQ